MADEERAKRKREHLELAMKQADGDNGFDEMELIRPALPETKLSQVDLSTSFLAHELKAPILIEAMTGGTDEAAKINEALSRIAKDLGIGLALGSCSIVEKSPESLSSFTIARKVNRKGLLFANCSPTTPMRAIRKTVKCMRADALQIHLNAVQEMAMAEGDRDLTWLEHIGNIRMSCPCPIIVKEVGFGLDRRSVQRLVEIGVDTFDIGGKGGTNFAQIELERDGNDNHLSNLADLGLTTAESLMDLRGIKGINIIASGGIRTPLDTLKCLVGGASLVGMAGSVLKVLKQEGEEGCRAYLARFIEELRVLLCLFGCQRINDAKKVEYVLHGKLREFAEQRSVRHG